MVGIPSSHSTPKLLLIVSDLPCAVAVGCLGTRVHGNGTAAATPAATAAAAAINGSGISGANADAHAYTHTHSRSRRAQGLAHFSGRGSEVVAEGNYGGVTEITPSKSLEAGAVGARRWRFACASAGRVCFEAKSTKLRACIHGIKQRLGKKRREGRSDEAVACI